MEEVEGLGKPSSTSSVAAGQRKKKKTTESADTVQIQWETPEVAKRIPAYSKTLEKFGREWGSLQLLTELPGTL